MFRRVPLALAIVAHNKKRLAIAVASISFASILMFQQQGYMNALFDSSSEIIRQMDCDLVIFSDARFAVSSENRFPRDALDLAESVDGVQDAVPVYIENSLAWLRALPDTGLPSDAATAASPKDRRRARRIRVIGFPLDARPFEDEGLNERVTVLRESGTAIIDRLGKREYGFALDDSADGRRQAGELADRRIDVVGRFTLGQDFANDGNLLVSQETLADIFAYRDFADPLSTVDLGLVHCTEDADPHRVLESIAARLPAGTGIMTRDAFIAREVEFWRTATPIGMIFTVGAVMGFAVGVIICYQILVDDISRQIGEYATLKAMGYSDGFMCRVVIEQATILSVLSFVPSLAVTWIAFDATYALTGLKMELTILRVAMVLSMTVGMCVFSGLLAIRRLIAADPASLFR